MPEPDTKKSVLLVGATGLVGNECLNLFLKDARFANVVTLTRRPLIAGADESNHVNHVIDFEVPESYRARAAADIVVCALGTTIKKAGTREKFRRVDFDYAFNLARAARAGGAGHFLLVSSKGSVPDSRFFYNQVKGELEAAISGLGFESLSIFRPSLLKGKRREFRAGEEVGKFLAGAFSFVIPLKWQPTPVACLARAILKAALSSRPGKRIYESGEILADGG